MIVLRKLVISPRKAPLQARSQATVDSLFEATIQVLLRDGLRRFTTIRVAERAGTSVGTLYQYYPNKQALLFAVLQRHVLKVGERVRLAAESVYHHPLATIVTTVVDSFVSVKIEHIDEARALYSVATELDSRALALQNEARGHAILAALLETASDVQFEDLAAVAYTFMAAMIGPTRVLIEGGAQPSIVRAWSGQLQTLCLSYLERSASKR